MQLHSLEAQATVERVDMPLAKAFIEKYHNLHDYLRATLNLGFYSKGQLIGVASFDYGPFPNFGKLMSKGLFDNKQVLRLCRFCCSDSAPQFSESRFIGACIRYIRHYRLDIRMLVSYVTASEGEVGTAWQATNWTYLGVSATRKGGDIHVYVFPLGGKREREGLLFALSHKIRPYPKKEKRGEGIEGQEVEKRT